MIKYIWWLRSSKTRPVLCLTRVHKHAVEVLQIQISCGIIILSRESIDVISLALGIIFQSWVTFKIMSWKRCFNYSTHLLPIVFSQDSKIPLNHFSVFIILLDFVLIFNLYIYHFSHNFNCLWRAYFKLPQSLVVNGDGESSACISTINNPHYTLHVIKFKSNLYSLWKKYTYVVGLFFFFFNLWKEAGPESSWKLFAQLDMLILLYK